MPKKYPVLKLSEILEILSHWKFVLDNSVGSHRQYIGIVHKEKRRVTVDYSFNEFDDFLIKSMMRQSGLNRNEFYCGSKSAAKKIGLRKL